MMSNIWLQAGLAFGAGALIGWFYFTGLWVTLRRSLTGASRTRALLLLALSYLARLALALAAFFWLATIGIHALLAGVAGLTTVAIVSAVQHMPREA